MVIITDGETKEVFKVTGGWLTIKEEKGESRQIPCDILFEMIDEGIEVLIDKGKMTRGISSRKD
jgi:hypothetical protein